MTENEVQTIANYFEDVEDPRSRRNQKHRLVDILTIGFCTILAGGEGFNDMELFGDSKENWLRTFLQLPNGVPSHDTFRKVFSTLDPKKLENYFMEWTKSIVEKIDARQIAIDGKALRASGVKINHKSPIHLVSAWCSANGGMALGQVKTETKSNEITAIPELLQSLELKGAIVSIDAAGCQVAIAKKIVEQEGDYVLALKGNQKTIFNEVKEYFKAHVESNDKERSELNFHDYFDDSHSRNVRRRTWAIHEISSIKSLSKWPGVKSVIAVENIRQEHREAPVTVEFRFYLSSLQNPSGKEGDRLVRGHWTIENQLHWSLDVTFSEDASQIRNEISCQNIGLLRRMAISLLKQETSTKKSLRQKKLKCGFDENYLLTVFALLGKM